MGLYARFVLPHLLAMATRNAALVPFRKRVGRAAIGRVLDLGIGTGLNLPFYGPEVSSVVGVDPSAALLRMAADQVRGARMPVELVVGGGERLPLDDRSIDTVVTTWTLCSVGDPVATLREARRVLRPGGSLLFVEHGHAPDQGVARWQDLLTPTWRRVAGGCHLNRRVDEIVRTAGFRLDGLRMGYLPGPKILTFMYEGAAKPG
jgi:ubiquinone/menaquinone biosynthesis C-methylase UbiE